MPKQKTRLKALTELPTRKEWEESGFETPDELCSDHDDVVSPPVDQVNGRAPAPPLHKLNETEGA
jgi:hypothetical protein